MNAIFIRAYQKKDVPAMTTIWNEVVQDGIAFPQEEFLTEETAADFFCTANRLRRSRRSCNRFHPGAIHSASQ